MRTDDKKENDTALAMGLMSGTSADGLTAAVCEISGRRIKTLYFRTYDYTPVLREKIIGARDMKACELSALDFGLGRIWAEMVMRFFSETGIRPEQVACIASHGQTVWHKPEGPDRSTMQIGEASFIAEATGIPVVCDFRPMDMAAGGEGAPLVPFLDEFMYGDSPTPVALQNIGGVGNISFTGHGVKTTGFDTGPGNSLMDTAVSMFTSGKLGYDADGAIAARGHADEEKVRHFLEAEYFKRLPPKSLDRSTFSQDFIKRNFPALSESNIADTVATLNLFTAASIALAFRKFAPAGTERIIVSGGGALNPVLMRNIASQLAMSGVKTLSSADVGMHPLAKEASCFALMGLLALRGEINHCPSATGASGTRILGKIIRV